MNLIETADLSLYPTPNYQHTGNTADLLADGKWEERPGYVLWSKQGVGWVWQRYVTITAEFGKTEPLGWLRLHIAGGGRSGVDLPAHIRVLVRYAEVWYDVGDLLEMAEPFEPHYSGSWVVCELATCGDAVQLLVVPDGPFVMLDELVIERGPERLMSYLPNGDEEVLDVEQHFLDLATYYGTLARYYEDERRIRETIWNSTNDNDERGHLLEALYASWKHVRTPDTGKGQLPLTEDHANVYAIQADLWRTRGRSPLTIEQCDPFADADLYAVPPLADSECIQVNAVAGETAYVGINLYSTTTGPVDLYFDQLPGAAVPDYVDLYRCQWTDTKGGNAINRLMELLEPERSRWTVRVEAGIPQQMVLAIQAPAFACSWDGWLVVDQRRVRFTVDVRELDGGAHLECGVFDYLDDKNGMTPAARMRAWALLRHHGISPWGHPRIISPEGINQWLQQWPDATAYYLTAQAVLQRQSEKAISERLRVIVEAFRSRDVQLSKLHLLLVDEPKNAEDAADTVRLAKLVKAKCPDTKIISTIGHPERFGADFFGAIDVACPIEQAWIDNTESSWQSYRGIKHTYGSSSDATPLQQIRLAGFRSFARGVTGYHWWGLEDGNSPRSSWEPWSGQIGSYAPLFLSPDRVELSKTLLAIHQAQTDYRLLTASEPAAADEVCRAVLAGEITPSAGRARLLAAEGGP